MRILSEKLRNIAMFLPALLLACLPSFTQACTYYSYSYYTYTYNYNLCDGSYCSYDYQCESNNCSSSGVCRTTLAPWAIFLIVFFSVFIFITILRIIVICCRKRQAHAIVIRNQEHHHHHDDHHHHQAQPEVQRLVVTQTTQQVPMGAPAQQQYNPAYGQPAGYQMQQNFGYQQPIYGQPGYVAPQPNMYQQQPQQQPQVYM
ncbi:UNKNOWN [Stylonychia lemnae]|uniref:Uncharacterized protein n=1 Tax=Stylonychia lemnae TaxID=5949 RepID=A0A078AIN4_STYLE|nr:UNKNOWN [Stylonychia lemnae]|eukprot:CDW81347.1 UNKNOWN [Stylonychia lemnae]